MIHWWASDVMLHFSKSVLMKKQKLIYILDDLRMSKFSSILYIFVWTIPLTYFMLYRISFI